jgi:hypothetical protein
MGRRKLGGRPIAQIRIVIGDHVETFDLEHENLLGRRSCFHRAAQLHDLAITYLRASKEAENEEDQKAFPEQEPPPVLSPMVNFPPPNEQPTPIPHPSSSESRLDGCTGPFDWDLDPTAAKGIGRPDWRISQFFLNDP